MPESPNPPIQPGGNPSPFPPTDPPQPCAVDSDNLKQYLIRQSSLIGQAFDLVRQVVMLDGSATARLAILKQLEECDSGLEYNANLLNRIP